MSEPNTEGPLQEPPHPEITENELAALPATKDSKQTVVDIVSKKLKDPRSYASHGVNSIDLWDEIDGTTVGVSKFDKPRPTDNAILIVEDIELIERNGTTTRKATKDTFIESPDGLQVERTRPVGDSSPAVAKDESAAASIMSGILVDVAKQGIAERDERELGLTFFSEKDAQDLAKKLERSKPKVYDDEHQIP